MLQPIQHLQVELRHWLLQKLLQQVPHQELPLHCGPFSLYLKPSSISLLLEYPLAIRLALALVWAEARRRSVGAVGQVEVVPQRFVKALAAAVEVQSQEALAVAVAAVRLCLA